MRLKTPSPRPSPGGRGSRRTAAIQATLPGFVVGLAAEARLVRSLGARVATGGGTPTGAAAAAESLAPHVSALISFGLAGGLDPALVPGALLVPATVLADDGAWPTDPALCAWLGGATPGALFGDGAILDTAAAKAALHARTGAVAVDLESAAVARAAARHGLPFAALRAICDPASRTLPRAALIALDTQGRIGPWRVAAAVMARPWDIPALIALGADAARARHALVTRLATIETIGSSA